MFMKKSLRKIYTFAMLALFGLSNIANAQAPIIEKTYDVSGKAKRGFLGGIEVKENGNIEMVYLVSSFFAGAGDVAFSFDADVPVEIYTYDKDLNLVNSEKTKVSPKKYSWFQYKGLYTYEVVRGFYDVINGLAFQKADIQYGYDPQTGKYRVARIKVRDKEKPNGIGNGKYYMGSFVTGGGYDVIAERSALIIAGKKIEKSDATKANYMHFYNHLLRFDILHCDANLNIAVTDTFSYPYVYNIMFSGQIKDQREETNDEIARDWVLLSASASSKLSLYLDPKPKIFKYLRISPQGKIVDNFSFESPTDLWRVEGVYEKDNAVYLYGSAILDNSGKKRYSDLQGSKEKDELTYTHYQIAKISKGKIDFVKAYPITDMQAKLQKPATQKKGLELTGEKEISTAITLADNGDIYISYQNYESATEPKWNHKFKNYINMFLFQFDAGGNFKKDYGIELPNKPSIKAGYDNVSGEPAKNYFYPSGDGKSIYWFISSAKLGACTQTRCDENFCDFHCWPLLGIDYTSINIETGSISDMKTFGIEKKNSFYVFNILKPIKMGDNIYFFSEDEKGNGKGGDNLRLTRIDISK
jgi:hypothetical protein